MRLKADELIARTIAQMDEDAAGMVATETAIRFLAALNGAAVELGLGTQLWTFRAQQSAPRVLELTKAMNGEDSAAYKTGWPFKDCEAIGYLSLAVCARASSNSML